MRTKKLSYKRVYKAGRAINIVMRKRKKRRRRKKSQKLWRLLRLHAEEIEIACFWRDSIHIGKECLTFLSPFFHISKQQFLTNKKREFCRIFSYKYIFVSSLGVFCCWFCIFIFASHRLYVRLNTLCTGEICGGFRMKSLKF